MSMHIRRRVTWYGIKQEDSPEAPPIASKSVGRIQMVLYGLVFLVGVFVFVNEFFNLHTFENTVTDTRGQYSHSRYPPDTEVPLPPSPSILHVFRNAAVCSESDICSKIGRDILQRGGNAVDSALATLACNGLVTMQSMGLGGGFIMNIFQKSTNRSFTVMARETAPLDLKLEYIQKNYHGLYLQGSLSIAVPAEVMGYDVAFKKFASMRWEQILEPTIEICTKGFELSQHQWDSLTLNPRIREDLHLRQMFIDETTDDFYRVGSLVHPPPELCETYRTLAVKGPQDFYTGGLAGLIAKDLVDIGSFVSLKDLKAYRAELLKSIEMKIGPDILHLVPPVGSGTTVGLILSILKGYYLNEKVPTPISTHRIVEAFKHAFHNRGQLGDPLFNDLKAILDNAISPAWAEHILEKIDDRWTYQSKFEYGGDTEMITDRGTGHVSVLATNGDAVSVTSTINYYFGSGLMGKRTGILFNSAMDDFSIPGQRNYFSFAASEANEFYPGKRPMSSMSPTIVTDEMGDVKLVVGGAGGPKIISGLANILLQVLWMGNDIKQAIDAPRFHHQLEPMAIEYEYGMLKSVAEDLKKKGHLMIRYKERGSAFCGIMKNASAIYANVDYRKWGGVSGF